MWTHKCVGWLMCMWLLMSVFLATVAEVNCSWNTLIPLPYFLVGGFYLLFWWVGVGLGDGLLFFIFWVCFLCFVRWWDVIFFNFFGVFGVFSSGFPFVSCCITYLGVFCVHDFWEILYVVFHAFGFIYLLLLYFASAFVGAFYLLWIAIYTVAVILQLLLWVLFILLSIY